jgi:hypothetical protein
MCDSYPVPVALGRLGPRPASQTFFGPREMLAVAGAGAQSTSAELVLAQAALPDAMLASRPAAATPSRHTIASKLPVGKLWAGGGGTVKVAVAVVFLLFSLPLSLLRLFRSTEPSVYSTKLLTLPGATHSTGTINYVSMHSMRLLYCKSQHSSLCTPPDDGIGRSEAQRLSCSTDWPPFPGKAISVASEAWRRPRVTSTRVRSNGRTEIDGTGSDFAQNGMTLLAATGCSNSRKQS